MTFKHNIETDAYIELLRTKLPGGRLARKYHIQIFTPDNNMIFESEVDGPNFTRSCTFTDSQGNIAWTLEPNRSVAPSKYTLIDPQNNVIAYFKTGIFRSPVFRPKVSVFDSSDKKLFTLLPGKLSRSGKLTMLGKYLSSDIVIESNGEILGFTGKQENISILDRFKKRLSSSIPIRFNYSSNRISDLRLASAIMVIHRMVIEDVSGAD